MSKKAITPEKKRLDQDLWVIIITTLIVFAIFIIFQKQINGIIKNKEIPILLRVLFGAAFQFGLAGLGITIAVIYRKERFTAFGLNSKGVFKSVFFSILCFVPYILFVFATNQDKGYLPFQSVWTTKEVLASGFPINAVGMLITGVAWGFFEGFNYVVISDKINRYYPVKNRWLNWGAITCAVICILIHGAIGVTPEGFLEMLTVLIIIYGMLTVKEFTGNAWGCIIIFVFFWNAF